MTDKRLLKKKIISSLESQGFNLDDNRIVVNSSREKARDIQRFSRLEKIKKHCKFLLAQNGEVKKFLLNGAELNPSKINIELRTVESGSYLEKIYRWWNFIWWSIPFERAYGRQMRFVLWDTYHDKPFGLIGLQSPSLRIQIRDSYLHIKPEERDWWVNMSMSAQRVGAFPPYNRLLGGKLVAMALSTKEIRDTYYYKYHDMRTWIKDRNLPANLLFITTTGAFGKSSIYNRVKYYEDKLIELIGYTKGSGAFHIPDELYQEIINFLGKEGINTGRGYGYGPSRKRQLLSIGFQKLEMPNFEYHGIKRAFYLIPHVYNLHNVIMQKEEPEFKHYSIEDLCDFWMKRWALKRAEIKKDWLTFKADKFWEQVQKQLEDLSCSAKP